ncbi:mechanosensitive ion channel domain-containing protein [Stieleria varia]|uniref:Miniconductance mechanosensitive channel MscM n=1 Tax=Stieleria varia TaxID=2528005 RepID=A0A5C6B135_9BACT|nr:mechanosensitive ion channel domain-containing protein [Stieleria varia]TWU05006.1 Miniconductance mechanosensitive channel MscM precursor [Stieleria varia]
MSGLRPANMLLYFAAITIVVAGLGHIAPAQTHPQWAGNHAADKTMDPRFSHQNTQPRLPNTAIPAFTTSSRTIPTQQVSTAPVSTRQIQTQATSTQPFLDPDNRSLDSIPSRGIRPEYTTPEYTAAETAFRIAQWNRELADRSSDFIAGMAIENAVLADRLGRLAQSRGQVATRLAAANRQLADIQMDYLSVSGKLAEYGLTPTIGLLLRHRKEQLDSWQTQDNESHFARSELSRTQQEALELELLATGEGQEEVQADRLMAQSVHGSNLQNDAVLRQQVIDLLRQRTFLVNELKNQYRSYHHYLDQLDSAASATSTKTAEFRKLIDRHATWIRSGEAIGLRDVINIKSGMAALLEFRHTRQFGRDLNRKLDDDKASGIMMLAFFVAMLVIRWRLKSWLVGIGRNTKMRTSGQSRIVIAGILTLGVAGVLPLICYAFAWWLGRGIVSETLLHVASGLYAASLISLLVELPRQLLRPFGLVDKHLSVDFSTRAEAFKGWSIAGLMLVPGAFAITVLGQIDHGIWRDSLGRFLFLGMMFIVAALGHFALRPGKGFLCPALAAFGGRLATGFGHLWYALALGFPVVVGILSALGYGYTASELIKRASLSLVLVMVAGVMWKICQIGFNQLWRVLTQPKVEPRYDEYGLIDEPVVETEVNETHVVLKHQIGFLGQCLAGVAFVASFAGLWVGVIPNMGMANPVLWTVQDTVTDFAENGQGQTIATSETLTSPITLLNLLSAAAILFVAIQLSRLLPNLFDALVLQRVDYDEGMEHLILVIGRFVLFSIGCFVACRLIGMRWATIQWLMVGVTIGLGFGLQDFVRNILGGLVVLFARPVNVGDRVTVGKLTGRIASQTLRTTILSDDEGRQLQIPNKKFLSDEVTNWRGAGKLTTVSIEVSVRREERPIDMSRMLGEWAASERFALQSPGPQVTLVCVAKQTQRYELHVWTEERQNVRQLQQTLLDTVRSQLRERDLLATTQPEQPSVHAPTGGHTIDAPHSERRSGRRSA